MNIVWKRPDGFHGASPEDYEVIQVANNSKIWLHKKDDENFPFRISGGWQDEDATKDLNQLVNLLNKDKNQWLEHFKGKFFDSKIENSHKYLVEVENWIESLRKNLKGDQWETTIMNEVLMEVKLKINSLTHELSELTKK